MSNYFKLPVTLAAILTITFCSLPTSAQNFLGDANSNYGGLKRVNLQPASIADNRLAFDVQVFGIDFLIWNNYLGLDKSGLYDRGFWADEEYNFRERFINEYDPRGDRRAVGEININLPGFMFTIGDKHAVGLTSRMRSMFTMHNVNPDLAKHALEELEYEPLWLMRLQNDNVNIQTMSWAEYGVTYGQVVYDEGEHFLKAGGTLKYLQGIHAGYLYARNLDYMVTNDSTLSIYDSEFGYGYSEGFQVSDLVTGMPGLSERRGSPTFGFDLGVVYEHRPDHEDHMYTDGQGISRYRPDENKYEWKVGFSILDIGRINFPKAPNSRNFHANIEDWNINPVTFTDVEDLSDTISNRAEFQHIEDGETFNMTLPTTFSLQVDYRFTQDLFANFTAYISPRNIRNEERLKKLNYFSITPRWEREWLGAALPLAINEYGHFNLGTHVRLGPLSLGFNDISTLFWKDDFHGLHFQASLNIPVPHREPRIETPDPDLEPEPIEEEPIVEEPEPKPEPDVEPEPEPEPETEPMSPEEAYQYLVDNYPSTEVNNLTYYVQVGAFRFDPLEGAFTDIERIAEMRIIEENDLIKAQAGPWNTIGEAHQKLMEIRNHVSDAFVVFYHQGERKGIFEVKDKIESASEDQND